MLTGPGIENDLLLQAGADIDSVLGPQHALLSATEIFRGASDGEHDPVLDGSRTRLSPVRRSNRWTLDEVWPNL